MHRSLLVAIILLIPVSLPAADPAHQKLFDRGNLVAWCIVPFDAKKRTPAQRVEMLQRLGFKKYAYDWRAEHLPTFDEEVGLLKKAGIEITAVWFPANLGPDAQTLLAVIKKHAIKTQLWVTMGDPRGKDQAEKVAAAGKVIHPIAEEAGTLGCSVGLYNHGGWFGEPENQLAVIDHLRLKSIGIVYNQHHGHDHIDRFPALLKKMTPHLLALNLNGMVKDGEKLGRKSLPLGQGDLDLKLLKIIAESGYAGPIGILGHTNDDAKERLRDNLEGLDWLVPQLAGKPAGPKPKPRTMAAAVPSPPTAGWLAEGRPEYRTRPITVECRFKIDNADEFNILVASDTKQSAAHWELFTWPKTGHLTVYMPGMKPDHVRSEANICDQKWHTTAMQYEPGRVRLFVDSKKVAEQEVVRIKTGELAGKMGFARLVEGGLGCAGELERVRISKGLTAPTDKELTVTDATVGLWTFSGRGQTAPDSSKLKNDAKLAAAAAPSPIVPPPGPHLSAGPDWKVTLLDRSADDAYMAVKADGAGNLFVGGREKVFVFEPDGQGGFKPRVELLRFPKDSIIIGLEYRGDDLYVLASHGLYLVPGGRVKRAGLVPKRILWGVPLDYHVSFHCLAWGPEGDLYLTHGDPLLNYGDWSRPDHWGYWTLYAGPDGKKHHYTGQGAVLKVKPDGSDPKVIARGLRGPVGLAFDSRWHLFTNDNDHESRADQYAPCRLLHVTPHADFGWPRGWMASKSPDRADLLDSIHPALGRGVPCDLAYYDEPAAPSLRGQLLMCRWDRFAVTRYVLKPKGATFTAEEHVFVQGSNQCRPTGIAVDTAGRIFVTSHYLGGNVVTPHCVSDLVVLTPAAGKWETKDETKMSAHHLWEALKVDSWATRHRSHQELIRRRVSEGDVFGRVLKVKDRQPDAYHTPWFVKAGGNSERVLTNRARDPDRAELRIQALRTLASFRVRNFDDTLFLTALDDQSPDINFAGLVGLFESKAPLENDDLDPLASNAEPVMRHTACTLLARRGTLGRIQALATSDSARIRLAAVIAAGIRLTVPPPDAPPPEGVPLSFPKGSAFFSPVVRFADSPGPIDLTKLGPIGSYTTSQKWAVGKHTDEEEKLFSLLSAALDDKDDLVRSQAAYYLGWLRDPRSEPKVAKVRLDLRTRGLRDRPAEVVKRAWVIGRLSNAADGKTIERGPIDLAALPGKLSWAVVTAGDTGLPLPPGSGIVYTLFRAQSRDRQPALLTAGKVDVWHNGRPVPPEADGSFLLDLQPGSNDLLVRTEEAGPLAVAVRARGQVKVTLPEKNDGTSLAERLKAATGAAVVPPEFLKIDWSAEGRKGDAANGRKLFGSLGCAKCHAITAEQTGGGAPSLTDAGKRFTPAHLAESILLPDRQVAEEFRATRVVTADGQVHVGLVVRESATEIELLFPDTTRKVLKTGEIEERKAVASSPMPAGLVKKPAELRDLLTYLLGDNPLPP